MTTVFDVWIPGIPKPQPRVRAFARQIGNGKAIARVYDPGTAEAWKGSVAASVTPIMPKEPLAGPVIVQMVFRLPRPKSMCRMCDPDRPLPHVGAGDGDNYAKAVLDTLTQIGLWQDDRQVFRLVVEKWYTSKNGRTGCELAVQTTDRGGN